MHQKSEDTPSISESGSKETSEFVENGGASHNGDLCVNVVTNGNVISTESPSAKYDPCCVIAFIGGVVLSLSGSYYFYVTGHQLSIASIRFETGYIGFLKDFQSFVIPGFLVICNTFCAQIGVLLFVPMVVYTRFSGSNTLNPGGCQNGASPATSVRSKLGLDDDQDYNTVLTENLDKVNRVMTIMFASFSFTHAVKLTVTMICSTLLRYHLMAYRIFVPNLMFQAVSFLVVLLAQLLYYLAHKWLIFRTSRFIMELNKRH